MSAADGMARFRVRRDTTRQAVLGRRPDWLSGCVPAVWRNVVET